MEGSAYTPDNVRRQSEQKKHDQLQSPVTAEAFIHAEAALASLPNQELSVEFASVSADRIDFRGVGRYLHDSLPVVVGAMGNYTHSEAFGQVVEGASVELNVGIVCDPTEQLPVFLLAGRNASRYYMQIMQAKEGVSAAQFGEALQKGTILDVTGRYESAQIDREGRWFNEADSSDGKYELFPEVVYGGEEPLIKRIDSLMVPLEAAAKTAITAGGQDPAKFFPLRQ